MSNHEAVTCPSFGLANPRHLSCKIFRALHGLTSVSEGDYIAVLQHFELASALSEEVLNELVVLPIHLRIPARKAT